MELMFDFLYSGVFFVLLFIGFNEFSFLFILLFLKFGFLFKLVEFKLLLLIMGFGLVKCFWEVFGICFILLIFVYEGCMFFVFGMLGFGFEKFVLDFWLFFKVGFLFVLEFILVC